VRIAIDGYRVLACTGDVAPAGFLLLLLPQFEVRI